MLLLCFLAFALILFVGQGYNANYGNVDAGYAGNPYPYNMHLVWIKTEEKCIFHFLYSNPEDYLEF